jgi:hypothetical protein
LSVRQLLECALRKDHAAFDAAGRAMLSKWKRDLLAGVPDAKIVELPGTNLYMFLSNEADIIRQLRAFGPSLPARTGL